MRKGPMHFTTTLGLILGLSVLASTLPFTSAQTAPATQPVALPSPKPLQPGAPVLTLWPPGHPQLKALRGSEEPETIIMTEGRPTRVQKVRNVHNPSLEVHLAPPEKANGMAVILAAGGGNTELNVGTEGTDVATWLNSLGVSAFIERYRLRPYSSATDALADTQRSIRLVRAHAKEWNVDPKKIGHMGFSAGGEQSARVALNFDNGKPDDADPIEHESCRPDFVALIYAGWGQFDFTRIPKDAPPAFSAVAGVDDLSHSTQTLDFYNSYLRARIPAELHIYQHGGHANGMSLRNGIPFGTWQFRFIEWAADLKMLPMPPASALTPAAAK